MLTTITHNNTANTPATIAAHLLTEVAEGVITTLEELEDRILDLDCTISDEVAGLIGDVATDEDTFHLMRIRHQGLSCTLADLSAAYSTTPERWWEMDLEVPILHLQALDIEVHIDWDDDATSWTIASLSTTPVDPSWAPQDDDEALDLYRALVDEEMEDQFGDLFLV